ncbi:MAG: DUF6179 domain-containing protein [Oscillospiraceae bacterium]|nr:DUF6179 domain-containing protein [Oscillospiraceae bacterium]
MDALMKQSAAQEPLLRRDYTLNLLRRAALSGSIPMLQLEAIRSGLHQAAAERAAAYTRGRSMTVTRAQAEAFYQSLFCQLDAVLLALGSDAAAEEALRSRALGELLEAGQLRSLQLYEEAKERFRKAYKLTKPVQTSFFHALLDGFSRFCTDYDARFRAADTKVEFSYPLLGGETVIESGIVGVHYYYSALLREAELLHAFDLAAVQTMMQRYADRFLTIPDMIAENIAELVMRHWLTNALCGAEGDQLTVTPETQELFRAKYGDMPAEQLEAEIRRCIKERFADRPVPEIPAAVMRPYGMRSAAL